jgi:hypothetical protein
LGYFFNDKGYAIILTNNGIGYILGVFFTHSTGHPDGQQNDSNILFPAEFELTKAAEIFFKERR